jgi:hypothetical protein
MVVSVHPTPSRAAAALAKLVATRGDLWTFVIREVIP